MKYQLISLIDGKGAGTVKAESINEARTKCKNWGFDIINEFSSI